MSESNEHPMDEVVRRLREERAEASDLELDRAKLRAISGASRASGRKRIKFQPRAVSTAVAVALLTAGGAAISSGGGGIPVVSFSNSASGNSQYCPPSSGSGGKPKPRPNKCGKTP
jgi:hypothetical protein